MTLTQQPDQLVSVTLGGRLLGAREFDLTGSTLSIRPAGAAGGGDEVVVTFLEGGEFRLEGQT